MRGLHTVQVAVRACGIAAASSSRAAAFRPATTALLRLSHPSSSSSSSSRSPQRAFSQTSLLSAKKNKGKKGREVEEDDDGADEVDSRGKSKQQQAASDFDQKAAFDLKDVEDEYKKIDVRFQERLRTFKSGGGRFNPDQLGQLRVQPDKKSTETYPLRDLATVVQKGGRTVSILASDESYIKPIISAVLKSREFNQQPQRDEDNELELLMRIEPENPEEQAKKLKAECNAWRDAVRDVFSARKIKHAAWAKAKSINKDDHKALDTKCKALQDKKMDEITKVEKQAQTELANRQKRL